MVASRDISDLGVFILVGYCIVLENRVLIVHCKDPSWGNLRLLILLSFLQIQRPFHTYMHGRLYYADSRSGTLEASETTHWDCFHYGVSFAAFSSGFYHNCVPATTNRLRYCLLLLPYRLLICQTVCARHTQYFKQVGCYPSWLLPTSIIQS